jgi:hypothetical protein
MISALFTNTLFMIGHTRSLALMGPVLAFSAEYPFAFSSAQAMGSLEVDT